MGYQALLRMREKNREDYGIADSVHIPKLPKVPRNYGAAALAFLREDCEDLCFDTEDPHRVMLDDSDGCSASPHSIPYNMERDLDRLSFEVATGRFLATGARQDAFDIYYCYCQIFKPFGGGYDSAVKLLEMLAEHESNASSLLMSHRDHFSHSVYVFLIGLALYHQHEAIRSAYCAHFGLDEGHEAAAHFLRFWGLTALFHDVGYPFEIAHQQMKAYACRLDPDNNDRYGFAPYVSYRKMDEFAYSRLGSLNKLFARAITEQLSRHYLDCVSDEPYQVQRKIAKILRDRPVNKSLGTLEYLHMDHAYFSGIMMAKAFLTSHRDIRTYDDIPQPALESLVAIILHNSLFKYTIRNDIHADASLRLGDGMPLAYLLFLCDELQCWDRMAYGKTTRLKVYPFDFDLIVENGEMHITYFFDQDNEERVTSSKQYQNMLYRDYDKKHRAEDVRSRFLDELNAFVCVKDVIPSYEPDTSVSDPSVALVVELQPKRKKRGVYLSDSSYLNLYAFALALNGRYCGATTQQEMEEAFEHGLSLEYKLSNIAQAKGFAKALEKIGCFYTSRPVDYEPVYSFSPRELLTMADGEHDRWCAEKLGMGWEYGDAHVGRLDGKNDNVMRERTRLHHDLIAFERLTEEDVYKDSAPMTKMLELIQEFEGLTVYRM